MDMAAASMTARWSSVEPAGVVGVVGGESVDGVGDSDVREAESRRRT